ncbi:E3 ubiquitin-protein ligase TRIM38-like [Talpa occidentalis]|uniref:E3 ubiquitin-protein ligase TRIM38-like n=1 Tax=Talpa occidentalis TaxID=50954 RepID=UPI00188F457A|nr:E3 ubiquitin-protein ligase TRIM38-like [Talpa occidentalis]XP_037374885.1 E3 ubiquitin-protein ligase TRIM38-like [Talpa occidentalis]XP_054554359.1 E3 ubiquitin-protein ligase TRIM38-like [Talpa occidentalis]XP_054554360.1 E3 ubiquitin-protein ligase TRIM38-like [Talpa occidentalis]XP_054554361.1 E3 ubiquitin-protein ligase TRIM38-like [Talpa occidentalis]
MDLATTMKKMKEEATCSICLQLMTAPSSIHCGHSFCRGCLEGIIEKEQEERPWQMSFDCPLCRTKFQKDSLRPMKQLENLIETIKEMERESLCQEHGEQLHLFCEDAGQPICWCCERSPQHREHNHVLVRDACPCYRTKIQDALTKLRKQEDECKSITTTIRRQIGEWEEEVQLQKEKIKSSFQNLYNFLYEDSKCLLARLEMEKCQTLKRLQDSEASVNKQSRELKSHILELEKKCQAPAHSLLQDVKDTLNRSSAMKLEVPEAVSLEIHTDCDISELYCVMRKILKTYQVDVTLDPETAHNNLILSEDGRRVTHGGSQKKYYNSRRFLALPCVLGSEGFTSGRHYFEVDVGQGTGWDLGVCLEDVPRDRNVKPEPESGFWVIRWRRPEGCTARTEPSVSLCIHEQPRIVGVFLDYEAGRVSFYNMPTGSHIFTFPEDSFSDTLRPFFRIYRSSPLFLPPPDQ